MIVKDTTVAVNFYVIDTDGFPATGMSSSITALMYINGSSATSISDSIYEIGDGWYNFNHNFDTEGNAFISFSASSCVIAPWEEYVIAGAGGGASAADIWNHSFSGSTASEYLYNASLYANSAYTAVGSINIPTPPTTSAIAESVWNYNLESNTLQHPDRIVGDLLSAIPSSSDIGSLVWGSSFMYYADVQGVEPNELMADRVWAYGGTVNQTHQYSTAFEILDATPTTNDIAVSVWRYNISNDTPAVAASTYLRSTYSLPSRVWSHSWGTPTAVSAYSYLTSIYDNTSSIDIPTPPSAGAIATSVWTHTSRSVTTTLVNDGAAAGNETYIATGSNVSGIPSAVWTYNIGPNTTTASTYLGSVGSIPHDVWTYKSGETETASDRSLTYYPAVPTVPTVESIWNYSVNNVSMKSYMISTDSIAANVWTQTSRSLTTTFIDDGSTTDHYFARFDDIPGADTIAGFVWDYSIPQANNTAIRMSSYLISTYNNTSSISIPTVPTTLEIAESVWTYSTTGNPSSDRSLTYYPSLAIPDDYAKPGDAMALTAAAVTSVQTGLAKTTDIPTVPTAGDIATSVWGYTIGNPAVSASTYLGTLGNSVTSIASSVDYNKAALLNWSLSTASVLALHIGNVTTTYSISRDLAGNITGVSPNN